ncbi:MAG: hypothetical protein WBV82_11560 [Myxococcaceae bacterium]
MAQHRLVWCLATPAVLGLLLFLSFDTFEDPDRPAEADGSDATLGTPAPKTRPPPSAPVRIARATASVSPPGAPTPVFDDDATREAERRLWDRRLDRARATLDAYLEATRYPPESRPIGEHPDQVRPSAAEREMPLDPSGDGEGEVRLILRQEKVFVVGQESVHFFVRCEDPASQPLPCEILSAVAHEAPHRAAANALSSVPLTFKDDGTGTLVARFQPANDGFPIYEGTLRVEIKVRSEGEVGGALFDIIYTPVPPAAFTGLVRESMQDGSLALDVGMKVRRPGRYVVSGRVDDATGKPFALLNFNEELEAGTQAARLVLFGRLVLDQHPVPPFTLRDVEGFLLRESGDPDRQVMASLTGPVHTTRAHPENAFSPAEWESEERERHVKEFTRDLEYAREKVSSLPP